MTTEPSDLFDKTFCFHRFQCRCSNACLDVESLCSCMNCYCLQTFERIYHFFILETECKVWLSSSSFLLALFLFSLLLPFFGLFPSLLLLHSGKSLLLYSSHDLFIKESGFDKSINRNLEAVFRTLLISSKAASLFLASLIVKPAMQAENASCLNGRYSYMPHTKKYFSLPRFEIAFASILGTGSSRTPSILGLSSLAITDIVPGPQPISRNIPDSGKPSFSSSVLNFISFPNDNILFPSS